MGHSRPFFLYFRLFNTVVQYKCLPMTGFEPLISGIGNDRSTNWPTTTARQMTFFIKNERDWTHKAKEVSSEKKNLNTIIKLFCHNRWPWQINKLFSGQWWCISPASLCYVEWADCHSAKDQCEARLCLVWKAAVARTPYLCSAVVARRTLCVFCGCYD